MTYEDLLQAFAKVLRANYPTPADEFAHLLTLNEKTVPVQPDVNLPVLEHMPGLLQQAIQLPQPYQPLVHAVAELWALLPWSPSYRSYALTKSFIEQFAVAEVAGPSGPLVRDDVIVFLFVVGAHTTYPTHWHAADELYLVLAGQPSYRVGGTEWVPKTPGSLIHAPSHVPHAIRNEGEPMLVLQIWRGDIGAPTVFPVGDDNRPAKLVHAEFEERP